MAWAPDEAEAFRGLEGVDGPVLPDFETSASDKEELVDDEGVEELAELEAVPFFLLPPCDLGLDGLVAVFVGEEVCSEKVGSSIREGGGGYLGGFGEISVL